MISSVGWPATSSLTRRPKRFGFVFPTFRPNVNPLLTLYAVQGRAAHHVRTKSAAWPRTDEPIDSERGEVAIEEAGVSRNRRLLAKIGHVEDVKE